MAEPKDTPEPEDTSKPEGRSRRLARRVTRRGPRNTNATGPPSQSQPTPSLQTQSTGRDRNIFRRGMNAIRGTATSIGRRFSTRSNARPAAGSDPASAATVGALESHSENVDPAGSFPAIAQPLGNSPHDEGYADQSSQSHTYPDPPPPSRTNGELLGSLRREGIYVDQEATAEDLGFIFPMDSSPPSNSTGPSSPPPSTPPPVFPRPLTQPPSNPRPVHQAPVISLHNFHRHHRSDYAAPLEWNVIPHRRGTSDAPRPVRLSDRYGNPLLSTVHGPTETERLRKAAGKNSAPQLQDQPTIRFVRDDSRSSDEEPHDHEEDDMSKLQKRHGFHSRDDEGDGGGVY